MKYYIQPEIQVSSIALQSIILAGSSEQETMGISDTESSSVW